MNTEIITIGDELLIGQIADTNSQWIAAIASENGFHINRIVSIPDKFENIIGTLEEAGNRSELVLVTGGLGPTNDDVTRRAISAYFQTDWKLDYQVYEDIRKFLNNRGIEMSELNAEQAKVPEKAEIYYNIIGTAPGMKLTKDNTIYVFMPGVQFEMKEMLANSIIPELKEQFIKEEYLYKIVITQGIPEAYLANELKDWEASLPEDINVAYLPSPGIVKIRLSSKGNSIQHIENKIDKYIDKLKEIIPKYYVATSKLPLEAILGETLKNHHSAISTAESCTGGNVAKKLTSIAGSSDYFEGSVVAYSDKIKQDILGVSPETIRKNGAVSKEVVEEMAKGVKKLFETDYAISISGIAGPTGGTEEKPIGTTWIAVSDGKRIISEKYLFGNKRDVNIEKASNTAIGMMRKMILNQG
ncbi:MAG: CinA family nicotinamide mononucleotide deamidase-related protein [Bacteroidota bacterium]